MNQVDEPPIVVTLKRQPPATKLISSTAFVDGERLAVPLYSDVQGLMWFLPLDLETLSITYIL